MWVPGHQGGESETIIGKWLKKSGKRDQVLITTKVGVDINVKSMPGAVTLKPDYILKEVEDSLKRLQIDCIDIYMAHRDDETVPLEESLAAFEKLLQQGKVRTIGASNYSATRLAEALRASTDHGYARYETLQPCYNLYDRNAYEGDIQDLCVQEDIGVVTYFSLACGFLTGKYRNEKDLEGRPRAYRVKEMMNPRGMRILRGMDQVARELNVTPAQIALAWVMAQPGIAAPIASATSLEQLEELVGAVHLELPADMLTVLDEASAYD